MDSDFREFSQTPRGRGFSLLGFILYLSTLQCFGRIEAVSGHLIGPKTWDRNVRIFLSPLYAVRGS